MVCEADILFLINKHIPDPAKAEKEDLLAAVNALITQANSGGGEDNISVILVLTQ